MELGREEPLDRGRGAARLDAPALTERSIYGRRCTPDEAAEYGAITRICASGSLPEECLDELGSCAFVDACLHKGVSLGDGDLDDGGLVCTDTGPGLGRNRASARSTMRLAVDNAVKPQGVVCDGYRVILPCG